MVRRKTKDEGRKIKDERRKTKAKARRKESLTQRLARLAQAIASASPTLHADVEALLEFYVDSEQRGDDVRTLYPAVWKHLQSCNRCHTSYLLLTEALSESSEPPTIQAERSLPFLVTQPENAAWRKYVRSRIAGAPLGFGFTIQAEYLQKLVAPPSEPALVLRNHAQPEIKTLLLSDHFTLGKREVMVELWTRRTQDPDQVQIEIILASSAPLPEPLHVSLRWNGHHYASQIQQGYGVIERIPIADLKNARDLHVDFEEIPPEPGQ
jgi:hypothetical protein